MGQPQHPLAADLARCALANPFNAAILARLPALGVGQCALTAGCVFQSVWNHLSGRPAQENVRDYDVFYFDDHDLSWDAEDQVIRQAATLFGDLGVSVEVRNQARVHLWYPHRFGRHYPPLRSSHDGVDRFLIACTCVAMEPGIAVPYAPYGVDDLWHGALRPNPIMPDPAGFQRKSADYQQRWPWLRIDPQPGAVS